MSAKFEVGDRVELLDEAGFPKGTVLEVLRDGFYVVRLDSGRIVETDRLAAA